MGCTQQEPSGEAHDAGTPGTLEQHPAAARTHPDSAQGQGCPAAGGSGGAAALPSSAGAPVPPKSCISPTPNSQFPGGGGGGAEPTHFSASSELWFLLQPAPRPVRGSGVRGRDGVSVRLCVGLACALKVQTPPGKVLAPRVSHGAGQEGARPLGPAGLSLTSGLGALLFSPQFLGVEALKIPKAFPKLRDGRSREADPSPPGRQEGAAPRTRRGCWPKAGTCESVEDMFPRGPPDAAPPPGLRCPSSRTPTRPAHLGGHTAPPWGPEEPSLWAGGYAQWSGGDGGTSSPLTPMVVPSGGLRLCSGRHTLVGGPQVLDHPAGHAPSALGPGDLAQPAAGR